VSNDYSLINLNLWMSTCICKCINMNLSSSNWHHDVNVPSILETIAATGKWHQDTHHYLQTIVAIGVFCPSLMCYHYNDGGVTMGQLPMAIVAYGLMFVVMPVPPKNVSPLPWRATQTCSSWTPDMHMVLHFFSLHQSNLETNQPTCIACTHTLIY
jgi:hypothetical protein